VPLLLLSCADARDSHRDLVSDPFPVAQAELREVVQSIADDVMTANIAGLQAVHLDSEKFTKFGPRSFDRQDVVSTTESEAAFFSSVEDVSYTINDLKIDVFGDTAVVTYYPHVAFNRDGEATEVSGRQTLVFLKAAGEWKIVHEHGTIKR
jgi:ketosteroid isomerase-like protein